MKLGSRSCEDGANFKYLETEPTTEYFVLKENKVILNSAIPYCHSFQNILPFRLLPKAYGLKYKKFKICLLFVWVRALVGRIKGSERLFKIGSC